jgi:multidrug transporter EmrE-like cation transporter
MQKLFRIPFIFLFAAGCVGLLLRWYFISPIPWLNYPNWLHGHSHTMFLGWVFNLVMLAYIYNHALWAIPRYRILFVIDQCLLVGMFVSFPFQGYGPISIVLSALHTVAAWIFSFWFFKDVRNESPSLAGWYAKISLLLFAMASLGPFALGPLMANGLGHSKWYYFLVYYYLHFQYNGVFIFALLSLWFQTLEKRNVHVDRRLCYRCGILLLVSLFPTYVLSVLWAKPGVAYNLFGALGAILQLWALVHFCRIVKSVEVVLKPQVRLLWFFALICFALKCLLQLVSSHPFIAQLALETRPFVIAYLHLVLIGTVTLFLVGWCVEHNIMAPLPAVGLLLLIAGFVGSELMMIAQGISFFYNWINVPLLIFLFSIPLPISFGVMAFRSFAGNSSGKSTALAG